MFEEILSENAISVIESLGTRLEAFYLAGGTGLALQLGHRKSNDFDFFSEKPFKGFDINVYHVLKSLVFFEDAEKEPSPVMLLSGKEWEWDTIKSFLIENIELFEKELIQEFC